MANDSEISSALLNENSEILARFSKKGTSLKEKRAFEFRVALDSKEQCKKVRENYRKSFKLPNDSMFILIDDPKDFQLILSVSMIPSAERVTEVEENLRKASEEFSHADVSWEFED